MPVVFVLRACRGLEQGGEGYLIYVIDTSTEDIGIKDISVVQEFPDVFSDEIPRLPHVREVEFGIELMQWKASISCIPYRLTPSDMRELKQQLRSARQKIYLPKCVTLGSSCTFRQEKIWIYASLY